MNVSKKINLVVPKRILFFEAASVWGYAGSRILRIGFSDVFNNTTFYLLYILIGIIGFSIFFKLVFFRMYNKHTKRIINSEKEKLFILSFFDIKGFIIMVSMITFGITLRKLNVIPLLYLGTFYISLGLSLFIAGLCFLFTGILYKTINDKYNESAK